MYFDQVNLQRARGYQALVVSGCSGAVRLSLCSLTAMVGCDCLHMFCLGILQRSAYKFAKKELYLRITQGSQCYIRAKWTPCLRKEKLKYHTLFRGTYLYGLYTGVTPHPHPCLGEYCSI